MNALDHTLNQSQDFFSETLSLFYNSLLFSRDRKIVFSYVYLSDDVTCASGAFTLQGAYVRKQVFCCGACDMSRGMGGGQAVHGVQTGA